MRLTGLFLFLLYFSIAPSSQAQTDSLNSFLDSLKIKYSKLLAKTETVKMSIEKPLADFQNKRSVEFLLNEYNEKRKRNEKLSIPQWNDSCNHLPPIPIYIQIGMDPYYIDKYQYIYEVLLCHNSIVNIYHWIEVYSLQKFLKNEYVTIEERLLFIDKMLRNRKMKKKYLYFISDGELNKLELPYNSENTLWKFQKYMNGY